MTDDQIIERLERAHRKAGDSLKQSLSDLKIVEPDWGQSKQRYCSSFISEIFVNADGAKDYDRESLSELLPEVIRSFGSEEFNARIREAILDHQRTLMNKKIIISTAMAILSSKFTHEEIEKCKIEAISESKVRITKSRRTRSMSIDRLLSKIEKVSAIKELLS